MIDRFTDNFSKTDRVIPVVYRTAPLPVFQNMFYASAQEARMAPKGEIALVQHPVSGFVYNSLFDPAKLDYQGMYNNEQAYSETFKGHLADVFNILSGWHTPGQRVVEIGAGKGAFWQLLSEAGYDCTGFDPAYEGDDPRIRKEYFGESHQHLNADVIILRHTLEHIQHPFSFLHAIAAANNYRGSVFIEVPSFDWILAKQAFWDVFYEHVNYFTRQSLRSMFHESTCLEVFGGQYIVFHAELSQLRTSIPAEPFHVAEMSPLQQAIAHWQAKTREYNNVAIWGAGGKGSTFLNIIDPMARHIHFAIDINPFKQNKFIGGTGHSIFSPEQLRRQKTDHIIIMNENYLEEIQKLTYGLQVEISSL